MAKLDLGDKHLRKLGCIHTDFVSEMEKKCLVRQKCIRSNIRHTMHTRRHILKGWRKEIAISEGWLLLGCTLTSSTTET